VDRYEIQLIDVAVHERSGLAAELRDHLRDEDPDLVVLEYTPREDGNFDRVVEQHLANVKRQRRRRRDQDSGVCAEVWRHAEAAGEATATDVVTLLERVANDRPADRVVTVDLPGRSPLG
jgi:hypothetical protein